MDDPGPGPLAGKVVIVSGASRRLGRCYALALARAGAQVVALARTLGDEREEPGTLRELEAAALRDGLQLTPVVCDLRDEGAIGQAVEATAARFGGVDALVCNAVASAERQRCDGVPRAEWDEAFQVNVRAAYVLIDAVAPHMAGRGGGSIVNVTSLAAGRTGKGGGAHRGLLLYGLTKAALNRLTTWYAAELEDSGIAVNAISPGDVSLYLRRANGLDEDTPDREVVGGAPLDEAFWGSPVVWLAGARSTDITGEILHTYDFGERWGPAGATAPRPALIQELLGRDNLAPG